MELLRTGYRDCVQRTSLGDESQRSEGRPRTCKQTAPLRRGLKAGFGLVAIFVALGLRDLGMITDRGRQQSWLRSCKQKPSTPRRMTMGFALFALIVGLTICWYGGYMTRKGREADRERRSHSD